MTLRDDGFVVLPAALPGERLTAAVRPLSLAPQVRRLAGVAPASEYLGLVAGQDPEQWLEAAG